MHNKKSNPEESKAKLLLEQTEAIAKTGSWELDLTTQELYWSDGVFLILEYVPQSFNVSFEFGMSVIHPDDREAALQEMNEAINQNKEYSIKKRFVTKNGTIKHILSSGKLLKDKNDQPYKIIGVFQDITDFVKTTEKLHTVKSRLEVISSTVDGILWEADANTFEFTYVSKQVEKILGYTPNEWLEERNFWQNKIHPDDLDFALNFCHSETLKGRDHVFEYRMLKKDGQYIWLQDRVSVISSNNKPKTLSGLLIDITNEKNILKNLEEEKNLNKEIIEKLPNVIFIFDENRKFLLWNEKLLQLSGYTHEEIKKLKPIDFFDKKNEEELIAHTQYVEKVGYGEIETEFLTKSKKTKPMLFISSTFYYKGMKCFYGIGIDLTQRNSLLEKQKKLNKSIEDIIQFAPESLVVLTKKLEIFKENNAFDELIKSYASKLNYTDEELKAQILNQINPTKDNKKTLTLHIKRKSES